MCIFFIKPDLMNIWAFQRCLTPVSKCVPPVGGLVGATAQVNGELSDVCVGARQHRQQLHEVHGPHVTVGAAVRPLLQAEFCDWGLKLGGQRYGYDRRSLRKEESEMKKSYSWRNNYNLNV